MGGSNPTTGAAGQDLGSRLCGITDSSLRDLGEQGLYFSYLLDSACLALW